ncbi:hypothetical protein [Fluviicola taffensis]|uniref:Transmembrane protein n=1 Tax=Fluviicola taffensis (strain DSM 16823 / NCIMB 13979 / RW262) TaxID=755732 RepID=F2IH24_FLUTR|nr:hypothetical protein [Fluviicola taffensis]AEA45838.1 hypothetical protein Fluta_3872 [Fluviicola taffensis DSM 16823]
MQQLVHKLHSNPKALFLIDGLGACLTALLIAGILIPFQSVFGMPHFILEVGLLLALTMAVYSLCCSFFAKNNWRFFLKIILVSNSLYCCLIAFFVFYFFEKITTLGMIYFLVEIGVIAGLVMLEMKVVSVRNQIQE